MTFVRKPAVRATGSTVVQANTRAVWSLISDIDSWPSRNPDVRAAHPLGKLEAGRTFDWKAGPGTIRSELTRVEEPSTISWKGTRVTTEESWVGVLPRALPKSITGRLQKAIDNGPEAIRHAIEDSQGHHEVLHRKGHR